MSRVMRCEKCRRVVAEIRDGKLIKGLIAYCPDCNPEDRPPIDVPDFMKGIFR